MQASSLQGDSLPGPHPSWSCLRPIVSGWPMLCPVNQRSLSIPLRCVSTGVNFSLHCATCGRNVLAVLMGRPQ
jgi:hypothetical protein